MTHADAFLQAILDAPDDDAPRLLFADWLDDHGDPDQAEFIRVQIALARGGAVAPGLRRREQELLAIHQAEWADPVKGLAVAWCFQRGFIHEVRAELKSLIVDADEMFRRTPITRLQLLASSRREVRFDLLALLADCPHLSRLTHLDLSGCGDFRGGLAALLVSPHLTNLTSLHLAGCRVGDAGVRALAGWPGLTRLVYLDLRDNGVSAAGLRQLARSLEQRATGGDPPRLRALLLDDNPFGAPGWRAVVASPILRRATQPRPAAEWAARRPQKR